MVGRRKRSYLQTSFVLIRMRKGDSYRKVCDTVEQCVGFIEMVKDSKEDFLDLELVVN